MQEETNVTSAQQEQQQKEEQQEEERQDEEDEDDKDDERTDSRDQNMQTIDQILKEIKEETKKQKQQLADLEVVFAGMYRDGHLNTDGGDVLTDALLYERGLRTDEYVYSSLYGLFPHQARQLRDAKNMSAVELINTRATLVANKDAMMPADLQAAFQLFLVSLQEDCSNEAIQDPTSSVGEAYCKYWDIYNQHLRS